MTSEKKIPQKKELTEKPIVGGGKVLVMEEEKPLRKMLSMMLELLGYESELARDGDEAIELYKKEMASGQPHNVVILDLTVNTGIGGEETIKKLLQIDPDVKAVISSGYLYDAVMTDYKNMASQRPFPNLARRKLLEMCYLRLKWEKSAEFILF